MQRFARVLVPLVLSACGGSEDGSPLAGGGGGTGAGGAAGVTVLSNPQISQLAPTAAMPSGAASYSGAYQEYYTGAGYVETVSANLTLAANFSTGTAVATLSNVALGGQFTAGDSYAIATTGTTSGTGTITGNSFSVISSGTLTVSAISVNGASAASYAAYNKGDKDPYSFDISANFVGTGAQAIFGQEVVTDPLGAGSATITIIGTKN